MILTVSQARQLVALFGVWPAVSEGDSPWRESCLVIPDPPMMFYIMPSLLEWRRN